MKLINVVSAIIFAIVLMFAPLTQSAQAQCPADVNHDFNVDGTDLTAILSTWGTDGGSAGGDINSDGIVNGLDLAFVLSGWGICPGPWATVLEFLPDAAVVTNATMRDAITASGLPWRVRHNSTSIEMLLVPGGTFTMGCSASTQYGCYSSESPTHQVTLGAFYIGRYEVTQAQWTARMGSNPSLFSGYSDSPSRPVEQVTWNMISSTGGFMSVTGLRLPTEAEWEYAYRAETTTAFHSYALSPTEGQPNGFNEDTLVGNIAWYDANAGSQTHAVGGKFANGLGLHDMAGNVREWCQDWYSNTYYASSPLFNPTGPTTGTYRVLRGGYWGNDSLYCRASQRGSEFPNAGDKWKGFRVARTADIIYISSVTPNSGLTAGGTAITITGASLTGATSVTVGGVAATSVVVVSSTSVTVVTPAGTVGAKSVVVTTPNGTASASNAFIYFAPTTISSVSPTSGSTFGGTPITITGTSLTGATSVTVGGVAATSVVVVSSTTITAVTPAGTLGAVVSVAVTTPYGAPSAASAFTYVVPYTVIEQNVDAAVVTDITVRNAITATGLPWRVRDTLTNIEMLLVPAGTFTMGCSASTQYVCNSNESPTHEVTLTQPFYMGRYEVTQAQWTAMMGSNPSWFQGSGYPNAANRPVERVSWNMIASGSTSFMSLTGLRLPTEAEWEYAYRAVTTTAFHSYAAQPNGFNDDTLVGNIAWYSGNNGAFGSSTYGTKVVGGKLANGLGLHDMAGNVFEWCQDWYEPYSSASVTNPTGPTTGTNRVLRGGDWFNNSSYCRASMRGGLTPVTLNEEFGFRVVRTP